MKKILTICSIYPSELTSSVGEFYIDLTKTLKNKFNITHVIALPSETMDPELGRVNIKKLEKLGAEIKIIHESSSDIKNTLESIKLVKEVEPSLVQFHFYSAYSLFNIYAFYKKIPLLYREGLLPRKKRSVLRMIFRNVHHRIKAKIFNMGITKIICVSDFVREEHARHYGVSKKKLITIYNGINLDRFKRVNGAYSETLRKKFGFSADTLVITYCGVMRKGKGTEYLVKAAPIIISKVKNTKFLIVGDGPLFPQIKKMIRELNLENFFVFTGWRSDVERILSISDVLVVPTDSTCPEACAFAPIEGMGVGVPVVASNMGCLKSLVEDGKTGFLVPPDNPAELADEIIKIITDRELATKFSENGIRRVKNYFSLERMVEEHIQLYLNYLPGYA